LFPLMIAMEYYKVSFETIPESIKDASAFMLEEHAKAFHREAGVIVGDHITGINQAANKALEVTVRGLNTVMPGLISVALKDSATAAVAAPVKDAIERFDLATARADAAVTRLHALAKSNANMWLLGVVFAAVFGGFFGSAANNWMLSKFATSMTTAQKENHDFGVAAVAAWPKLNAASQKAIQDVRTQNAAK